MLSLARAETSQMIPCFDEPAYKVTFAATIEVPAVSTAPELTVIFNTAAASVALDATRGVRIFDFERTLHPLPIYLLALAVGNFDHMSASSGGVTYSIYTPPGYGSWATLALNATVHAAEYFGRIFGLPYSHMNQKMDSISVAGLDMDAMENQGLLTYSPQMLLLNPDTSARPPSPLGGGSRLAQAQLIVQVTSSNFVVTWSDELVIQ